jgi:hypothetical protein
MRDRDFEKKFAPAGIAWADHVKKREDCDKKRVEHKRLQLVRRMEQEKLLSSRLSMFRKGRTTKESTPQLQEPVPALQCGRVEKKGELCAQCEQLFEKYDPGWIRKLRLELGRSDLRGLHTHMAPGGNLNIVVRR